MGNYTGIKNSINADVYENTTGAITATVLNGLLNNLVDELGTNANFMGMATPATVPTAAASVDGKQFYFAIQAGTYHSTFGGVVVSSGDLWLFYCDAGGWHETNLLSDLITKVQTVETAQQALTSAMMQDISVNQFYNNPAAFNTPEEARTTVEGRFRTRFMMLRYIYLDSGFPKLRVEMYTENSTIDLEDNSVWSDASNWTVISDITPVNGFA